MVAVDEFSKRLNLACDKAGIPSGRGRMSALHRLCTSAGIKVSQESVRKWLSENAKPRMNNAAMLARLLGADINELMSGSPLPGVQAEGPDLAIGNVNLGHRLRVYGKVPLISWVNAGRYREVIDHHQPGVADEWIETTVPIREHTFALRVEGDSMEPEFPPGTVIIVEPDLDAQPGDYVVVRNGENEATFKQLVKDGADWLLKPMNPRYPIKPLTSQDSICGVVRSAEKRYR